MNDALRSTSDFPLAQPHNGIFPTVGSGGEMVTPSVLQQSGTSAIVDWILLELRANVPAGHCAGHPFRPVAPRWQCR